MPKPTCRPRADAPPTPSDRSAAPPIPGDARLAEVSTAARFLRLPDYGVLPQDFAARVPASAGLQNIIVHEYNDVDHRIVHATIRSCLGNYVEYVRRVSAWLDRQEAVAS